MILCRCWETWGCRWTGRPDRFYFCRIDCSIWQDCLRVRGCGCSSRADNQEVGMGALVQNLKCSRNGNVMQLRVMGCSAVRTALPITDATNILLIISMIITRLNFGQIYPQLLQSLSQAHFVALDLEMSGIVSTYSQNPSLTDTIELRYQKTKEKVSRFIPLQLGLCTGRYVDNTVVYTPYNIYMYPLTLSERESEQFSFNAASMGFLAKNGFDFNQLFYEGVPFISSSRIARFEMREKDLREREQQAREYQLRSPEVVAWVGLAMRGVEEWVSAALTQGQCKEGTVDSGQKKDHLLIDIQFVKVKAYQSLIYTITKRYPSLSLKFQYLDKHSNPCSTFFQRKYLRIARVPSPSPEPSPQPSAPLHQLFNTLFHTLRHNRTPLIVHNGFLDLMHIYNRFIDDLPPSQGQYKKFLHEYFPYIYDTKYICNNNAVLLKRLNIDTSLGNCFKMLRSIERETLAKQQQLKEEGKHYLQPVQSKIDDLCSNYSFDLEQCHEAGYDALMTAYTFVNSLSMLHYKPSDLVSAQFHNAAAYYCNKVPLGNIRVPFDFSPDDSTRRYEQDGARQLVFTCLLNKHPSNQYQSYLALEAQLHQHFGQLYGPARVIWLDKARYNFMLTFLDAEQERRFWGQHLDGDGHGIYVLKGGSKYLVSLPTSK